MKLSVSVAPATFSFTRTQAIPLRWFRLGSQQDTSPPIWIWNMKFAPKEWRSKSAVSMSPVPIYSHRDESLVKTSKIGRTDASRARRFLSVDKDREKEIFG